MIERLAAFILIVLLSPLMTVLSVVIIIDDGWPFWYGDKRVGKNGKIFKMWKFRSMIVGADKLQESLMAKNEANGPVFKIYRDPRHTRVGRFLFQTGLDELLQLFNIVRGEMAFVGPRPLPIKERNEIAKKYLVREKVLPGVASPWIFNGYHTMKFEKWMESDSEYVKNKNWKTDMGLAIKGIFTLIDLLTRRINSG
jgi:lipopolysaccharide/colanic/teichoic acid biosynthesis glycosyltransferase